MRIIAGRLGGRNFPAPKTNNTHPMSEKMRGALFNMLGDIRGLSVLDAFSGSGALAFEAASRGARQIVAVERDKQAYEVIAETIKSFQLENTVELYRANVGSWSNRYRSLQFNVVLLDPPYQKIQSVPIEKLFKHTANSGVVIVSLPPTVSPPTVPEHTLMETKTYGDSTLTVYKRTEDNKNSRITG